MISLENVSLKYRSGKGISDIDFKVKAGTVMGYLGPNGAGKTTTIRVLMGFMKPDQGACSIKNMDCFQDAAGIKAFLGYIPGEIAFPGGMKCSDYLKYQCSLRGIKDLARMRSLMERFELAAGGSIKKFSKGMKQKVGIITAFMHDPDVLILDEPTSGLDPLMQNEFIRLLQEERQRGKTILISSHSFEEIERTCNDVMIIRDGRIVAKEDVQKLKSSRRKGYRIITRELDAVKAFGYPIDHVTDDGCTVYVRGEDVDTFIKRLGTITITGLEIQQQTLEDIFLDYYGAEAR